MAPGTLVLSRRAPVMRLAVRVANELMSSRQRFGPD